MLVSLGLDQHVEDLAFGVDGAPEIEHSAVDFQIDLVKMPGRARLGPALSQVRRDERPEMIAGGGTPSGVDAGPKRYSAQRKMAMVARLLRGEPLDVVAREANVSGRSR
jgi:hypothetical protein